MDQNLQNYIAQARALGQTDVQIMTSLLQSGWSQTQVNEAFGIPSTQPAQPTQKQGGLFLKIFLVIVIIFIIGLIVSAGVGYFFVRGIFGAFQQQINTQTQNMAQNPNGNSSENANTSTNIDTNTTIKGMHCEDLLSKADAAKFLGVTSAQDVNVQEDLAGQCGDNSVPACDFESQSGQLHFRVAVGTSCDGVTGEFIPSVKDSYNQEKSMLCSEGFVNVAGVGSEAVRGTKVYSLCGVTFLSISQKYYVTSLKVLKIGTTTESEDANAEIEAAKIIDNNLNKY